MKFPGGKEKALTFSYDDAVTQDLRLLDMMNRHQVKGTFNINTGCLGKQSLHRQDGKTVTHNKLTTDVIAETYAGHELAVHGLTHLDLARVPSGTAAYEVMADRRNIEAITKAPVRGMAYPFGTYNEETLTTLKSCGIVYARTVRSTGQFGLPEDFLRWHPTCHHADEHLDELTDRFLAPQSRDQAPKLFYVWGHSYEFDVTDSWDAMETFLDRISGRDDIWYATNGEIYDYVTAYNRLIYTADGNCISNPSAISVWTLVGEQTYEIPAGGLVTLD
jgi:peptidoglycan/xylan/chitin deacetylase (PgdA/CDA1 family)